MSAAVHPLRQPARGTLVVLAGLVLAACASSPPAPVVDLSSGAPRGAAAPAASFEPPSGVHRVVRGDTLYAIAFRHGLDFRDVAAWNGIEPPYRIYPGQEVRLTPPPNAPGVAAAHQPQERERQGAAATAAAAPVRAASSGAGKPGMFEDVAPEKPVAAANSAPPVAAAPAEHAAPASAAPPAPTVAAAPAAARATEPAALPAPPAPPAATADSSVMTAGGVTWRWPGRGALIGTFAAGDQTRQGIDIAGNAGDPVVAAADGEVVYSGNGLLGYGELIIVKHNASYLSAYGHNRKRLVQEGEHVKGGQQIAEMGSSASSRDELHFEIRKNGKPVNPLDYLPAR